jgi:hypothetical protein
MKCITLHRPWGLWVRLGWKRIETRLHDRFGCLCGERIGIHNGQTFDEQALAAASRYLSEEQLAEYAQMSPPPAGQFECTVFVDDAHWLNGDDSKAALIDCSDVRRFGLYLKDVLPWPGQERVVRGFQGIWEYPPKEDVKQGKLW